MDNNLNQDAHLFLTNRNSEFYNSPPGDFNSEDLYQHLPGIIEVVNKTNGPGINPFPGGISMPQSIDTQDRIPAGTSPGNPGVCITDKEVLMELCTVSPPLNAFLRKAYSNGSFYFLHNKIHDFGK